MRLHLVVRLVEHLGVQPADYLTAAARPERAVRVLREHQMVRPEACADVCDLLGCRVIDGEVPSGIGDRIKLCRRMTRSFFAEIRIGRRPHSGGQPHTALLVEHRIVDVVLAGPDRFFAPVRRRLRHRGRCCGRARIAHGQRNAADRVADRIEHRQIVGAQLQRSVDETVRVERGIPSVGSDRIVEIRLRVRPVPLRDDDVAFDTLRPRRRRRHLATRHTVGPVGEHGQCAVFAQRVEAAGHLRARLTRLNSPIPRFRRTVERAELFRNLTRAFGAELVTRRAAAGLQSLNPVRLALDVRRNAVAAWRVAGELALLRHANQGEPVACWVILGCGAWIRGHHRRQVHDLAGCGVHLGRVDQPVAAHPYVEVGLGQIGQKITSAIVCDDDLDELRREIRRLCDHPDACLRPLRARDDAAEVVGVDADRFAGRLTGLDPGLRGGQQYREAGHDGDRVPKSRNSPHGV